MSVLVEISSSSGKAWRAASHSGNGPHLTKCFLGLVEREVNVIVHENLFQGGGHAPEMIVKVTFPTRRAIHPETVLAEILKYLPWFRDVSLALYLYNSSAENVFAERVLARTS